MLFLVVQKLHQTLSSPCAGSYTSPIKFYFPGTWSAISFLPVKDCQLLLTSVWEVYPMFLSLCFPAQHTYPVLKVKLFPRGPFVYSTRSICVQILNNYSFNTSKNVTSHLLFRRSGWNLSPCSQMPGFSCRSGLTKSQPLLRDASCSRWEHSSGSSKSDWKDVPKTAFFFTLPQTSWVYDKIELLECKFLRLTWTLLISF